MCWYESPPSQKIDGNAANIGLCDKTSYSKRLQQITLNKMPSSSYPHTKNELSQIAMLGRPFY